MLAWLLREHPFELEADFQEKYHVDVYSQSPRRVARLLTRLLTHWDNATFRAIHPEWQWMIVTNQIGADSADRLRWLQWAKSADGQKNRNRPPLYPRPGVPGYGRDPAREFAEMDIEALEAALALPRVPIDPPVNP